MRGGDPDGIRSLMQYLKAGFYPLFVPAKILALLCWKGKLTSLVIPEVMECHKNRSLRDVSREFGVSHETIRRTLAII